MILSYLDADIDSVEYQQRVDSIKDFPFSPTQISELIIFILNNDCTFQSQRESIDYDKNNIIDVYPKVFQCLRQS